MPEPGVCACGWTAVEDGRCADCRDRWLWDAAMAEEDAHAADD